MTRGGRFYVVVQHKGVNIVVFLTNTHETNAPDKIKAQCPHDKCARRNPILAKNMGRHMGDMHQRWNVPAELVAENYARPAERWSPEDEEMEEPEEEEEEVPAMMESVQNLADVPVPAQVDEEVPAVQDVPMPAYVPRRVATPESQLDGDLYDNDSPGPAPVLGQQVVVEDDEESDLEEFEVEEPLMESDRRGDGRGDDPDWVDEADYRPQLTPQEWPVDQADVRGWIEDVPELDKYPMAILQPWGGILCFSCGYCTKPQDMRGHLERKHAIHSFTRQDHARFLVDYADRLGDIKAEDGGLPIPHLYRQQGYTCTSCDYKTVDRTNTIKHAKDTHGKKAHEVFRHASLQSYFAPTNAGWIEVRDAPLPDTGLPSAVLDNYIRSKGSQRSKGVVSQDDPRKTSPFYVASEWGGWTGSMTIERVNTMHERMASTEYGLKGICHGIFLAMYKTFKQFNVQVRCRIDSPT